MNEQAIIERLDKLEADIRCTYDMPLTEEQAAAYLHLSVRHMARLRSQAEITYIALGGGDRRAGKILYYRSDLDEYLRRSRRKNA
ncbi:MAG: helix-turn-helix domain-containing protein [Candidatus Hydrogenedentes bacterium]|nr:helix-turn-helix domain-containing protein [Candidatus Hydrogenedentota bacterium]